MRESESAKFFACEECWKRGRIRRMSECAEHCLPMAPAVVASIEADVRRVLAELDAAGVHENWPAILGEGAEGPPDTSILDTPYPDWTWPRWSWRKKLQEKRP